MSHALHPDSGRERQRWGTEDRRKKQGRVSPSVPASGVSTVLLMFQNIPNECFSLVSLSPAATLTLVSANLRAISRFLLGLLGISVAW